MLGAVRSVFVFPAGDRDRTRAALDRIAGDGDPWVLPADDGSGPALYVRIGSPDPAEWTADELGAVTRACGRPADWTVAVDVSGRVPGGAEVRRLVLALLDDGGVAVDERSGDLWTAAGIEAGGFFAT